MPCFFEPMKFRVYCCCSKDLISMLRHPSRISPTCCRETSLSKLFVLLRFLHGYAHLCQPRHQHSLQLMGPALRFCLGWMLGIRASRSHESSCSDDSWACMPTPKTPCWNLSEVSDRGSTHRFHVSFRLEHIVRLTLHGTLESRSPGSS